MNDNVGRACCARFNVKYPKTRPKREEKVKTSLLINFHNFLLIFEASKKGDKNMTRWGY